MPLFYREANMGATDWLKDSGNQNLLKFLGGAVVAIAVAGWTAYSTVFPKETAKPAAAAVVSAVSPVSTVPPSTNQNINAASGSAAIGNVTGGAVTINVGK
jgi:hypothetical protein